MSIIKQPIPCNLITGFLGSGKSTAILNLLKNRKDNAPWAVLVNEFGDVGIDGAMFKQKQEQEKSTPENIYIKEVPGGCMCCAAGLPLQIALNLLIKQAQPERILIEPTGIGHPKKVLDVLTGEFYQNILDIRSIICLVEPHKLNNEKYRNHETFMDQMNIADVLLASKSDQAKANDIDFFFQYQNTFSIEKIHVEAIEQGVFSPSLLDYAHNEQRHVTFPYAHKQQHESDSKSQNSKSHNSIEDAPTKTDNFSWQRFENNGHDYYSCGWVFHRDIIFSEEKLEAFVKDKQFSRVKGIFHTLSGWWLFNRSDQEFSRQEAQHDSDSRLEMVEMEAQDWFAVEQQLLACMLDSQ